MFYQISSRDILHRIFISFPPDFNIRSLVVIVNSSLNLLRHERKDSLMVKSISKWGYQHLDRKRIRFDVFSIHAQWLSHTKCHPLMVFLRKQWIHFQILQIRTTKQHTQSVLFFIHLFIYCRRKKKKMGRITVKNECLTFINYFLQDFHQIKFGLIKLIQPRHFLQKQIYRSRVPIQENEQSSICVGCSDVFSLYAFAIELLSCSNTDIFCLLLFFILFQVLPLSNYIWTKLMRVHTDNKINWC